MIEKKWIDLVEIVVGTRRDLSLDIDFLFN